MKSIIIGLLSVLCFAACSKEEVKDQQPAYMSIESIMADFNNKEVKSSIFVPNAMYEENMARLVPADEFKPKQEMKKKQIKENMEVNLPILDSVDLRSRDTAIKNQGKYGYCTAFGLTAIMENIINKTSIKQDLDLSEWHMWSFYKVYQMDSAIKAMNKNKVCDEVDFKQGGKITAACTKNAHAIITSFNKIDQSQVTQTLSNGLPVYFGLNVPRGMSNCEKVIKDENLTSGGHALEIAGYLKDKTTGEILYIIKNSWGKNCADNGYQYLRANYCQKTWCYFYEVDGVSSKYDSIPTPPIPEKVCVKWKTVWYAPWKQTCKEWK